MMSQVKDLLQRCHDELSETREALDDLQFEPRGTHGRASRRRRIGELIDKQTTLLQELGKVLRHLPKTTLSEGIENAKV